MAATEPALSRRHAARRIYRIIAGLAVMALIASFTLARDWRFALPAWLYTLAAALVCVDLFLFAGESSLWLPGSVSAGASLLAVVWVGWFVKLDEG